MAARADLQDMPFPEAHLTKNLERTPLRPHFYAQAEELIALIALRTHMQKTRFHWEITEQTRPLTRPHYNNHLTRTQLKNLILICIYSGENKYLNPCRFRKFGHLQRNV